MPTAAAPPSLAALLTQATRSLENLSAHLQTLVLPDALDAHVDACVAFGKACIPVAHLLTEHPALLGALQDQLPVAAPPKRPAPKGKAAKKRAVVQRKAKV